MNKKGILVCISGFSGAGKGTVLNLLIKKYEQYALSISATSRKPRKGEQEGVHYFYKTKQEFEQLIAENKLIEYAQYVDNYYGTPSDYVFSKMEEGKDVILEIEIQGALQVKEKYPETVLIFIMPPSAAQLKERLEQRGTEDAATITARLKRAAEEAHYCRSYDYVIINDDLKECLEELHQVIQAQHGRACQNADFIEKMKNDLKVFVKGE